MKQRFLNQEESGTQEAERLSAIETLSAEQQAPAAPIGNRLDPEFVDGLMRQLDQAEGSRTDPRWMLPFEREALLKQLTQKAHSQQRLRQGFRLIYGFGITLFIAVNVAFITGLIPYPGSIPLAFVSCYTFAFVLMKMVEMHWGRTAARMALIDDPRAAGPLMEALALDNKIVVADAEKALARLLPRLQASDADSITEAQRACLYRRLKMQHAPISEPFLLSALKALEQIGDAKAIPSVETLAETTAATASAARIQEAAKHCLEFLRLRAAEKQSRENLLRASSRLETTSDALLRPLSHPPNTDPQHLLRSSDPPNFTPEQSGAAGS